MQIYGIILVTIGIMVAIGFLRQFGVLTGKRLIYAIAGAIALFGGAVIWDRIWKNRDEEFKRREEELEAQEQKLKELEKEYDLSKEEVFAADAALRSEKGKHEKVKADIEAQKAKDVRAAKDRNNNMTIKELLSEF